MNEVKQNTIIELGLGKVSIDRGTCGGVASVFIEPVSVAGTPGEKGPVLPLNSVQPGTIIIRINDQRGADVLAEKLSPRMHEALVKLNEWFETLQGPGTNDPLRALLKRAHETPRKIIADALQPSRIQENDAKVVPEIEVTQ